MLGVAALAGVLAAGLMLPFVGGVGLGLKSASDSFEQLPGDLAAPPLPQRTTLTYADGTPMATFYETSPTLGNVGNRVVVSIDQIAPVMQQAIVAIEDSRFYQHGALDVRGTLRALLTNAESNSTAEGASTLTQQYVKNLLELEGGDNAQAVAAASEKSLSRKLRELKYAVNLAKTQSKQQILADYLNIAYFGNGAYGVEAAAERYFNTTAAKLTLPQAAMLAGIVQSPGTYDPLNGGAQGVQDTLTRRNTVLQRMADPDNHMITQQQADQAKQSQLSLTPTYPSNGCAYAGSAAFFCAYVVNQILSNPTYGKTAADRKNFWDQGGLTITTTLSPTFQNAAQQGALSKVNATDQVAAAVDTVEPGTGKILAMAQTRPYGEGSGQTTLNYSVDAADGGTDGFQTGSTFKVFFAAAAIDKGQINPYTDIINAPANLTVQLSDYTKCDGTPAGSGPYSVPNEEGDASGPMNMQTALALSINTFFMLVEKQIGICEGYNMAVAMGVHRADGNPLEQVASMTLGTNEIAPLTMAQAYATFAARGIHCDPIALTSVVQTSTKKAYAVPSANCTQVMQATTADTMNDLLSGVLKGQGTAAASALADGRPAAGKTGTTDEKVAAWFVGYTPQASTSVWTGIPEGNISMNGKEIGGQIYSNVFGATLPAPIWKKTMDTALAGQPVQSFVAPPAHATATAATSAAPTSSTEPSTTTLPGWPGLPSAGWTLPGGIVITPPGHKKR